MKISRPHIITTFVSQLLLAAIVLTLFFGQGVHLHFSFHDLFDHHDSSVVFHSHASSEENHDSDSHGEDSHQHSVATIEFNASISNSVQHAISKFNNGQAGNLVVDITYKESCSIEQFAIPPPNPAVSILSNSSLSLRAPPEA